MQSVAIVGTKAWEMREEPADYLGHEAAGEVIEVAQPSKVKVGDRVIFVARNPYRIALGERLGASAVVNAHDPDAMEQLRELSGGGPTAAVDTSGAAIYIKLLISALRRRGKLAIIGEGGEVPIAISDGLIRNGLKVYGLWHYSLALTQLMIEMIAAVSDQLDVLITHEFPLNRVEDAWRLQQSGRCGKVILRP